MTYETIRKKYLTGEKISKTEAAFIKELSTHKYTTDVVERENARVLHHCIQGEIGLDSHTRNLAIRRTSTMLSQLIQSPCVTSHNLIARRAVFLPECRRKGR